MTYAVANRARNFKQPRGGYLHPKLFNVTALEDAIVLAEHENIAAGHVSTAVDYLTRIELGTPARDAFWPSLAGAREVGDEEHSVQLLSGITGLDHRSITHACQLVGYDVAFRNDSALYREVRMIQPDQATTGNVRAMVERTLSFFDKYGPIVLDGFTFEGGYTETVSAGDGDFLTSDTLWDLKVSVKPPLGRHTLQVLMYYLMGKRSIHSEFDSITHLGLFNPRLNAVHRLAVDDIPADVIDEVAHVVIGYR